MDAHGHRCMCIMSKAIHGDPWICMHMHGRPLVTANLHPHASSDIHGGCVCTSTYSMEMRGESPLMLAGIVDIHNLDSHGYPWISMQGYPWISVMCMENAHGHLQASMDVHELECGLSMHVCNKHPQPFITDTHEFQWTSMDMSGSPWISMDTCGECSWILHRHSRLISMAIHGHPLIFSYIHAYRSIWMADTCGCWQAPTVRMDIHGYPIIFMPIPLLVDVSEYP